MKDITDGDWKYGKRRWKDFTIQNLGDHYDL